MPRSTKRIYLCGQYPHSDITTLYAKEYTITHYELTDPYTHRSTLHTTCRAVYMTTVDNTI